MSCGYIFDWRGVKYHFRFTVTLAVDLVSKLNMSRAYILHKTRKDSNIRYVAQSCDGGVSHTTFGSLCIW